MPKQPKNPSLKDFEETHDFSWALKHLQQGKTVRRGRWEPTSTPGSLGRFVTNFVVFVPREDPAKVTKAQKPFFSEMTKDVLVEAHFARGTWAGLCIPNCLPSIDDLLANVWALGDMEYM